MNRLLIFVVFLAACGPSEAAIQEAIDQTEAAQPTETALPPTNAATAEVQDIEITGKICYQ